MSLDTPTTVEHEISKGDSRQSSDCPVCDSGDYQFLFTKGDRKFWRCRGCGSERIWPVPSESELEAYYESSYQEGMYQAFAGATEMKRLTAIARYRQIAEHCRAGRWLDVGCSTGMFVEEAMRQQMDCQGVDLSQTAVDQARSRGLQATCGTLANIGANAQFDSVTAFDVLEHVTDPVEFLTQIHDRLTPGGTAAITVPNLRSLSRLLMGRRWYFYIPEEHLNYFSPASLNQLLAKVGFETLITKKTYKPLTFEYSLLQFEEYNPWIHRVLSLFDKIIPKSLRRRTFPLYIGEMMIVARKPPTGSA